MPRPGLRVRIKAAAIEEALARRNWTKTQLAGAAGLHRTHLSDLLAGRTSPGPRTRRRLLRVLGGEFDDFFVLERKQRMDREPEHSLLEHCTLPLARSD